MAIPFESRDIWHELNGLHRQNPQDHAQREVGDLRTIRTMAISGISGYLRPQKCIQFPLIYHDLSWESDKMENHENLLGNLYLKQFETNASGYIWGRCMVSFKCTLTCVTHSTPVVIFSTELDMPFSILFHGAPWFSFSAWTILDDSVATISDCDSFEQCWKPLLADGYRGLYYSCTMQ